MLSGSSTLLIVIGWGLWTLGGGRLFRESRVHVIATMVFVVYLSQLLAVTIFPLPIESAVIEREQALSAAGFGAGNNFVPFTTLREASRSDVRFVTQIGGNFLLLTPLGFFAPLLWARFRSVTNAAALVVATTLAIEFSQLGISGLLGFTYRSFDVDDLWLNALGGIVAIAAASLVRNAVAAIGSDSREASSHELAA